MPDVVRHQCQIVVERRRRDQHIHVGNQQSLTAQITPYPGESAHNGAIERENADEAKKLRKVRLRLLRVATVINALEDFAVGDSDVILCTTAGTPLR